jgi:hypothetical protein
MEFVICLFRKTYSSGEHREYVLVEKTDDENYIHEAMEYWGESSDGGHGYGYTVHCDDIIEKPTQQVIDHLIKEVNEDIKHLQSSIEFQKICF